jgi:hypothetical protein
LSTTRNKPEKSTPAATPPPSSAEAATQSTAEGVFLTRRTADDEGAPDAGAPSPDGLDDYHLWWGRQGNLPATLKPHGATMALPLRVPLAVSRARKLAPNVNLQGLILDGTLVLAQKLEGSDDLPTGAKRQTFTIPAPIPPPGETPKKPTDQDFAVFGRCAIPRKKGGVTSSEQEP